MNEATKKKYDTMSIITLEGIVKENMALSREAQVEMIEALIYLKVTYRYKENRRYAKEPFRVYLEDNFGIKPDTFLNQQRAVSLFRDESVKYGTGLVSKAINGCGEQRAKMIFKEVQKAEEAKGEAIPRQKIIEAIEKNRRKEKKKPDATDWKTAYHNEKAAHDQTREKLRVALSEVDALTKQIDKLKNTAGVVTDIRKAFTKRGMSVTT